MPAVPGPAPSDRLADLWGEIRDLEAVEALAEWDQETQMPPGGVEGRARVAATLAAVKHAKLTSPALADAVAATAAAAAPGSVEEAQAAEARRQVDRASKVPAALAAALAAARSTGVAAWQQARERRDFARFAPHLAHLVDLKRQEAAALAPAGRPYDALLDDYEPGATEAELAPLFATLRRELSSLVRVAAEGGHEVDESPAHGSFPAELQRQLGHAVAQAVGFDFAAGRLDRSAHPFCQRIHDGDVRLTWRFQEDDFRPAFFGILHETGHGLYEQGLPREWSGTPLGATVSLGIHESQSRLWENQVGRSRAFWRWALPRFTAAFPESAATSVERLWPALHTARPTPIRVEADEATYNLHVIVRFEIERELFAGRLEVAELPGRWNDLYDELLGIRPADDAEGVLQDIHWSMGSFGYFPTYTLGTLAAAQLFAAARAQLGDLEDGLAAGDFAPLLAWLREHVHRHGSRYRPGDLIARATGKPLAPDDFLTYLREVTAEVYALPS
jgi:carboxypeptidase Taq